MKKTLSVIFISILIVSSWSLFSLAWAQTAVVTAVPSNVWQTILALFLGGITTFLTGLATWVANGVVKGIESAAASAKATEIGQRFSEIIDSVKTYSSAEVFKVKDMIIAALANDGKVDKAEFEAIVQVVVRDLKDHLGSDVMEWIKIYRPKAEEWLTRKVQNEVSKGIEYFRALISKTVVGNSGTSSETTVGA
ncbi:MAG: hypothetical protein PHX51_08285 [Clostridia bacterium]|nr:hypothetical protein [Clostridia bacterium]